ncbi:FadR/GntR family transcriptional regulator [Clostridium pasteurianum]|uniref:Transcriptional regulator n=1 Tax=Clostridium pasteurianum BC1 TaxID=86416 RepID=R4K6H3_CLOPA|nr:FadR/GntR family transcriptional regulator [Clostridium pasteurianum]AGK98148.1 transcriptional regulator [Clostridium pasteurianum BC1]
MFSPIKNTKVYEQVIIQIKDMIAKGILRKGDKLPSERELVDKLGVSRTSIREALRALEIIGLVESRQGEGNFIRDNFENSLFEPLSVMFMLQKSSTLEIHQVRVMIETETASLAAKNIKDKDIEVLQGFIDKLKNSKDELERSISDKNFHYKIAECSGNFLINNILRSVSSLMDAFIVNARMVIVNESKARELLVEQHEDILQALIDRDSEAAVKAMRKHLDCIKEHLILMDNIYS